MLNMYNENVEAEVELHDALKMVNVNLKREVIHDRTGMQIHYLFSTEDGLVTNRHIVPVYDYMHGLTLVQLMNNCTFTLWKRSNFNFYKLMGDFVKFADMTKERAQRKEI